MVSGSTSIITKFILINRHIGTWPQKLSKKISKSSSLKLCENYWLVDFLANNFLNRAEIMEFLLLNFYFENKNIHWKYYCESFLSCQGMMSTAASLGMLLLWDVDGGLTQIDKYLYSSEDYIKVCINNKKSTCNSTNIQLHWFFTKPFLYILAINSSKIMRNYIFFYSITFPKVSWCYPSSHFRLLSKVFIFPIFRLALC